MEKYMRCGRGSDHAPFTRLIWLQMPPRNVQIVALVGRFGSKILVSRDHPASLA